MGRRRNVMLEDEMREPGDPEIDVTEEEANAIIKEKAPPAPVVPTPAPQMSMTVADIQAIVRAAVEASQGGNKEIAEIVTQGIAQARKPIPEGTDASNPRISAYNPLGERDHPRPGLKCEFFLGTKDSKGLIQRNYPWLDDDLTAQEQIALNTLEPFDGRIKLLDGSDIPLAVVPVTDAINGRLQRMVIVVPQFVIEKKSQVKNMLPNICNMVEQITHRDFSKLSNDDLAWFMAEHRAKRYVAAREKAAA